MKAISVTRIEVHANPGAVIGECMKEALELAAHEWRNVRLTHSSGEYMIRPNDMIASIEQVKKDGQ
jgi:hypothetical protein